MAHKTFISYKYDEARNIRDRIIVAMGNDAIYYKGETSLSPNLSDLTTNTIKQKLSDMLYDTSVTIVVISPRMKTSNWMEWEISHSLRKETRNGRTSNPNGFVGVVMKVNGGYDWFEIRRMAIYTNYITYGYKENFVFDAIKKCRNNLLYKYSTGIDDSYLSYVDEDAFLSNPSKYINEAFMKSNHFSEYQF